MQYPTNLIKGIKGFFNIPIEHRIEKNIERIPFTDCWIWIGSINAHGYGKVRRDGKVQSAHRVSYELSKGKIPDGLNIDHLCRIHCCINPDHLEAVTQRVNVMRGFGVSAMNLKKEKCPKGHLYNATDKRNRRFCKECRNEKRNIRMRKQRHEANKIAGR